MKLCIMIGLILTTAIGATSALLAETPKPEHEIIVYYFHRTARCTTCLNMEAWTEKIVETSNDALVMKSINLDRPEHHHFIKDFDLDFGAVVVAEQMGDVVLRWKRLDDIWNHSDDETAFTAYVMATLTQDGFMATR
ncbi:MAG TPA: nitrophenyl compound nitroreductase subunit ArsF family protein [Kiritimatiellia bacterium]|nr:nitrophenyl compound nitroreductase subunit ArsF family protein [Kiritimatiellia bacterium]